MGVRAGGVVAVHAHPDDETLTSGALLATAAAAGLPATVVTCTRGERGEVIGSEHHALEGDGPALARRRTEEIAAAMRALGGVQQVFLDELPGAATRYTDSGMVWVQGRTQAGSPAELPAHALVAASLDEVAGRLACWLRDRRPELVVTDEPGGGYGHPDHVRCQQIVARALQLLGSAAPVLAWAVAEAAELRCARRAIAADPRVRGLIEAHAAAGLVATREGPLVLPAPDGPLPAMARVDAGPGFAVPVGPVRAELLAGLSAHATQVQAVTELDLPEAAACYALSNGVLTPVLPAERYQWADRARTAEAITAVVAQQNPVA